MYRKHYHELLQSGIEKERSKAELDICRRIQLSQLPDTEADIRHSEMGQGWLYDFDRRSDPAYDGSRREDGRMLCKIDESG